jgi:hypothetical protein
MGLLPAEMKGFFDANRYSLVGFTGEPDAIAEIDRETASNHFIDLDAYSQPPFSNVPSDEQEFVKAFGNDALKEGRLPWAAADEYKALVAAFKERDYEAVLKYAGHLSHYVADATMPLHATKNYKGQFSGNVIFNTAEADRHVHVRFEVGMINANKGDIAKRVRTLAGRVHEVKDPAARVLALAEVSYGFIDPILDADKELLKPGEEVTPAYYSEMYKKVGDLAVQQMALASTEVASLWQGAWVEAGRPRLMAAEVVLAKPPLTLEAARAIRESQEKKEGVK